MLQVIFLIHFYLKLIINCVFVFTHSTLYVNTRKDVRQGSLLNYYHFICDCEACVENYPTFENMKKVGGNIYSYAMNSFNELKTLTKSQAQYKLKKHCEMIQNRPNLSNTYEGAIIQDCILSCMMILIKTFQFE